MKKLNYKSIILFVAFLLLSLVSHGIYTWAAGLLILFIYTYLSKTPIRRHAWFELITLIILILCSALWFNFFLIHEVLSIYHDAFFGNLSMLILCALIWFALRNIFLSKQQQQANSIIPYLLLTHIVSFYVQFVTYMSTGIYIDLLKPFTGNESRYISFDNTLTGIGSFRPTGFFLEPSTYFMCVMLLLSLVLIKFGFSSHKKLVLLTIISMFLSFSTAAVIIASLFLLYYMYTQITNLRVFFGALAISVIILGTSTSQINNLYNSQTVKYEKSSGIRFELITLALKRDIDVAITAFGPFAVDADITEATSGLSQAAALNDSGLLIFLWVLFGYVGIAFFLLLCFKQYKAGKHHLPLFLLISLTKVSLFHPIFLLYLTASLTKNVNNTPIKSGNSHENTMCN